jgi:hypothetical protein
MGTSRQHEQDALAQVMRADEEEARREMWWKLMPSIERRRALGLAKLDQARADNPLSTFTVLERARMHSALTLHVMHMETLRHCCGILEERRPVVDLAGAASRQIELEQQQEQGKRRRDEFARLQQEQEQQQGRKGQLH